MRMALKQSSFRESDEFQRGRNGELRVAEILQRKGWSVIPSYDYSGSEGDMAPRLQGLTRGYPVPDLDVSREGQRLWVEVKTKARPDWTRKTQRLEHGIPLRHYEAYCEVERITGTPVWLCVIEESSGDVLKARARPSTSRASVLETGGRMSNSIASCALPRLLLPIPRVHTSDTRLGRH